MTSVPRSFLFTPGSRPDRFAKAAATAADALILDLEDAVADSDKAAALSHVLAFMDGRPDIRQQIVVRINPISKMFGMEDLVALAKLTNPPDYLLIPKAEEPAQIKAVADILSDAGSSAKIGALIESARGVAQVAMVAEAHERLAFLMFGAADYAADLGQQVQSFRPNFARASIVNAAAAGGIVAIDSPFFAIDRMDDLVAECAEGRGLGFHGKAAIHPLQLESINHGFAPTEQDRTLARRIVEAAPHGVGVLDGKMIDIAMVRWARRVA